MRLWSHLSCPVCQSHLSRHAPTALLSKRARGRAGREALLAAQDGRQQSNALPSVYLLPCLAPSSLELLHWALFLRLGCRLRVILAHPVCLIHSRSDQVSSRACPTVTSTNPMLPVTILSPPSMTATLLRHQQQTTLNFYFYFVTLLQAAWKNAVLLRCTTSHWVR
ncbi:hypothetical protein BKA81DRAFT_367812 [Phyllosticta paracitricarpa]